MNSKLIIISLFLFPLAINSVQAKQSNKDTTNFSNEGFSDNLKKAQTQTQNDFSNNFGKGFSISDGSANKSKENQVISGASNSMGIRVPQSKSKTKAKRHKKNYNYSGSDSNFGISQNPSIISTGIDGNTKYNPDSQQSVDFGTDFTKNTPRTTDENTAKLVNYRSCLRILINSGKTISETERICHNRNPGVVDSADKVEETKSSYTPESVNNKNRVLPTPEKYKTNFVQGGSNFIAPNKNASTNDIGVKFGKGISGNSDKGEFIAPINPGASSYGEFIKPGSPDPGIIPPSNAGIIPPIDSGIIQPSYNGSECDVSRDIKVLFSSKCLNRVDTNVGQNIGTSPLTPLEMGNIKPINIPTPAPVQMAREVSATPKNAFTCEYNFIPSDTSQKSKQGSFHPKAAVDCLKKALAFSFGAKGVTDIVMTTENGDVSVAKCKLDEKGKSCKLD